GSKAHTEYEAYNNLMVEYDKQEATFGPRYEKFAKEKDKAGMKSIQKEYQAMMKDKNEKVVKPYIESHPSSPIVVFILNMFVGYDINPAVAEPLFNNLSAANRN